MLQLQQKNRHVNQQNDLSWLLNIASDFDKEELTTKCFKPISSDYEKQIITTETIIAGNIYSYSQTQQKFEIMQFRLIPNIILVKDGEQTEYLILSGCTIRKKILYYKETQAFGLVLLNQIGNAFLFFSQFISQQNWYKQLKKYCKLSNFSMKYKICEQMMQRIFISMKKKNKTLYTTQIYMKNDLVKCPELQEVIENEIHLIRSVKHQSLLELKGVYEDNKHLYMVFEYFKGQTLFSLLQNGLILDEIQMASIFKIIYQSLQLLKFLNQHTFFHGNISPLSIIINTSFQMLQIICINLSFKEYKENDKIDFILNRTSAVFLAPELQNGKFPGIQSDLYSLGVVLYFMTFLKVSQIEGALDEEQDFQKKMQNFFIDEKIIAETDQIIAENYSFQNSKLSGYKMLFSASQIDLLKRLLVSDPAQRITLESALKHHWFINVKSKLKLNKVERKTKKALPSLKTIIELKEQSEYEMKLQPINVKKSREGLLCSPLTQNQMNGKLTPGVRKTRISLLTTDPEEQIDEENTQVSELMKQLNDEAEEKRPSKKNHELSKQFLQFKTFSNDSSDPKTIDKFNTIS